MGDVSVLRCDGLQVQQGDFTLSADLAFANGAITALIGPSGAGKSTLLSALAGFVSLKSGRVLWGDTEITALPPGERPISILFQDNNLFPHLTALQNVGLALRPDLRLLPEQKDQVARALADVGLTGMGARKPAALSGGQQSRVALARVLLAGREVVLLDEPFAALGPGLKEEMLDLVRDKLLKAGRCVVMVTHDPADAKRIADNVVLVSDGVALPPVPTDAIFENPPPALQAYLG